MATVDDILARHRDLQSRRLPWEPVWQDIADLVLPRRPGFGTRHLGAPHPSDRVFDSTAVQSAELLAAALLGTLSNPSSVWFSLRSADPDLDRDEDARAWLDDARDRILFVFNAPSMKLATHLHELYLDLAAYGTGALFIGDRPEGGIQFSARHLAEIFVAEDANGQIDTVFRQFRMSARNAVANWGTDRVSRSIARAAEAEPDREFDLLHAVFPRADRDPQKQVGVHKPFASVYVERDEKHLLGESGFDEMPYMVPRWYKAAGEIYGRSPAMTALPDIKMLNAMMKTTLKAAQKSVDPPLIVADDGVLLPVRTVPGGLNFAQFLPNGGLPIQPMPQGTRFEIALEIIRDVQARVRAAFYTDQLLLQPAAGMTATEVVQRTEEKLKLMGPQLGRMQGELLGPMIDRVFGIMFRRGAFPPPPPALAGEEIRVEYVSPIAKAQRASEAQGLLRLLEATGALGGFDPAVVDNLDADTILRRVGDVYGVPNDALRSREEVEALRAGRAEAAAAERMVSGVGTLAQAFGRAGERTGKGAGNGV